MSVPPQDPRPLPEDRGYRRYWGYYNYPFPGFGCLWTLLLVLLLWWLFAWLFHWPFLW